MNKDIGKKKIPQLAVLYEDEHFVIIYVFFTWQLPWQRYDAITFFTLIKFVQTLL